MLKKPFLIVSTLLFASTVNAQGGYIGASFGTSDIDVPGFDDGSSVAFSGGFRMSNNLAYEISYIDLGEWSDNIAPVWTAKSDGINFAAVGLAPVSDKVDLFGKVGIFIWDLSVEEAGFGEFYSNDGTDLSYGFGALVNLTGQFDLVFEYQKFEVDDEDVSNMSFGARMNF